jgi:hypothetical protein
MIGRQSNLHRQFSEIKKIIFKQGPRFYLIIIKTGKERGTMPPVATDEVINRIGCMETLTVVLKFLAFSVDTKKESKVCSRIRA